MLSEIIKRNPNKSFMDRLKTVPSAALFTSTICVMELRFGALKRGSSPSLWPRIEQNILPKVRILSFTYKEAIKAGELISHLYSSGQLIGIEDIMIGSIALCNGLTVVSANTRHFSRIPDLKIDDWSQSVSVPLGTRRLLL
ncbi:MAG: PIN domain-containing protein [Deltaproteobacteria bacterium]|nr:PIN domain-containing protein [Deltaproteobacteria bacterium]